MPMDAAAVDKLMEKAKFQPEVAFAVAEAVEIAIKAENLVTVPMLDARFAAADAKMEARFSEADKKMEKRFSSIEKSISSAKVWAVLLYAGLAIIFFGSLAADHRYLASRQDEFVVHSDQRFEAMERRLDATEERTNQRFQQVEARLDSLDLRMEQMSGKMEQLSEQMGALLARSGTGKPTIPSLPSSRSR